MFLLGTEWDRYTWYLRLPGGNGSPWAGIIRVECAPGLTDTDAIGLLTYPRPHCPGMRQNRSEKCAHRRISIPWLA